MNRRSALSVLGSFSFVGGTGILSSVPTPIRRWEVSVDVSVLQDVDVPISFDATVLNGTIGDGPARIELSLRNASDRTITYRSGAPAPFGILVAATENDVFAGPTLWTDAYERSDDVTVRRGRIFGRADVGLGHLVEAGETATEVYSIRNDDPRLGSGSYVVRDRNGTGPLDDVRMFPPNETVDLTPDAGEEPVSLIDLDYAVEIELTIDSR